MVTRTNRFFLGCQNVFVSAELELIWLDKLIPAGGGPSTSGGPTATVTSQTRSSTGNDNEAVNSETFRAQIRLNTQMMSTIEGLRNEVDQLMKERNFFKLKWTTATEQIGYLKKKVVKNGHDENVNPNVNADESQEDTNKRDANSREQ